MGDGGNDLIRHSLRLCHLPLKGKAWIVMAAGSRRYGRMIERR